ncbi:MAG TPA: molybdopterin-dependent oxidoreductase [Candidatus Sulfopaludibacter sp.]|nr:molybdopterin-dependent oxidoreductase [Candidatus Sulfopaludibacter sp.]
MVFNDFPFWLRFAHFINLIFIVMLIRSGIEILSALPKLYWHDNAIPGKEWIRFTKKKFLPDFKKRVWISLEEEESFPSWLSLPGHKNLGMGRHWHFFSIIFWILNGAIYYILLFTSNEWQRLVPTSWSIFPQAFHTMMQYANFNFTVHGNPYDPIQQLAYFGVIFILGPFMIATGAAMSPAIGARFPWYPKIFRGRQVARSLHFLGMVGFVLFIIIHISMVMLTNFPENMGNIFLGKATSLGIAIGIFALFVLVVLAIQVWATGISLRNPRFVQHKLGYVIEPLRRILFRKAISKQQFLKSDITPFFRANGYPPDTKEYKDLLENKFINWKMKVHGLVENPFELSLADLHAIKKEIQITEHSCIQGWTAIGEWGGISMNYIISRCKPLSSARYVVFYSYQYTEGEQFYEAIHIELAKHHQTILAYEMNGEPLDVPHGAPLRLRIETQLGFKMVKWIKSIEFVSSYQNIGKGQGGHREDNMYYGIGAGI